MPAPRHTLLATIALVVGGFAIGTTEFVTMGLLPEIARGVSVSIPTAGHTISAYAAGVVVGAPLLAVLGATWPRKALLVGLTVAFVVGNIGTALAPDYAWLMLARFVSGMPHGAFFGVAALVAVDMAARGQAGRAVSRVMLGIPFANVAGVPGATWLGQQYGWRAAYWLVAVLGVLTIGLLVAYVPHIERNLESTIKRELKGFATTQVGLTLAIGAIGFGGMFAMASYIAPTVTDVTGLDASAVPIFLLASGIGGLVGTPIAGRLADWSVLRSITIGCVGMGANLVAFALTAQWWLPAIFFYFLSSVLAGILVVNLQLRLMQVAGDAQTLAAASNHAALNTANALGAWLGGVVIAAGYGYTAPSWVGAGLSVLGAGVLGLSLRKHRADTRPAPARTA
ncbi:MFS transporter [Knoellia flava TL1]|uniref:MFS transporter n=2 Tax=Knoellia flava TaxID=913969 RepID=A0ABR4XIF3_9MICO|nr:MFS transporter [Knoellia flava]KGN35993.1 MFS transporter [Knoellia flava TL1]GGB78830.1 putative permease of the major facilitator superfamily protein [Knoellia flava]